MATDTSAPLPDLKLQSLSTFTVTLSDPNAKITQLVIHGDQVAGPDIVSAADLPIYLQQSDANLGRNPGDFGGPGG
jgi:hypothetical protein